MSIDSETVPLIINWLVRFLCGLKSVRKTYRKDHSGQDPQDGILSRSDFIPNTNTRGQQA